MKKPLYLQLAMLLQRQRNLSRVVGTGVYSESQLKMKTDIEDEIELICKEHLPSGSGFDGGTQLDMVRSDSSVYRFPGRLSFTTAFHHMDEHGGYCGWSEHCVDITPDWEGFRMTVTGRDRSQIKDYIAGVFHAVMNEEIEVTV